MVLSETEAQQRLDELRRQRDAIDRAITDLTLYLELGRRLGGPQAGTELEGGIPTGAAAANSNGTVPPEKERSKAGLSGEPTGSGVERTAPLSRNLSHLSQAEPGEAMSAVHPQAHPDGSTDPPPSSAEDKPGGASARRYGRALVRAAVSVLEEARRPLHVSEILALLSERGFAVPGQQDPVAALNTRLWKRSGPGGAVQRLGDAIYALPDNPATPS